MPPWRRISAARRTICCFGSFTAEDVPDPAIGEAAFALEEGEGQRRRRRACFGSVIVRVTEITPGGAEPLAECRGRYPPESSPSIRSSDLVMNVCEAL